MPAPLQSQLSPKLSGKNAAFLSAFIAAVFSLGCAFTSTTLVTWILLALSVSFGFYAVFLFDSAMPIGLLSLGYFLGLIITGGDTVKAFPCLFSVPCTVSLFLCQKRKIERKVTLTVLSSVLGFCSAAWFLLLFYREHGSVYPSVIVGTISDTIHALSELSSSLTGVDVSMFSQTENLILLLLPASVGVLFQVWAWISCSLLRLPSALFSVKADCFTQTVFISPITGVLYLISGMVGVGIFMFDDITAFSAVCLNLFLLLLPGCSLSGWNALRPRKIGQRIGLSPFFFVILILSLILGFRILAAATLFAVAGAIISVAEVIRRILSKEE